MTRPPVTRLGRKLDIVSLILVAAGAIVFLQAFLGMKELRDMREAAFVPEVLGVRARWYDRPRCQQNSAGGEPETSANHLLHETSSGGS